MSAAPLRGGVGWTLALVLWGLLAWRLTILQQPQSRAINGLIEDRQLFEQALQNGLLVPGDNGEIRPLARDELLARQQRGETVDADTRRLFSRLQYSLAGHAVRAELQRWNRSRAFAAVRDNSRASGVRHSGWQAHDCGGGRRSLGGIVPEAYGFLHQAELKPDFGRWQVAAGSGCVEFSNDFFADQPQQVTLWLIGQPLDAHDLTLLLPLKQPKPLPCGQADQSEAALRAAQMTLSKDRWQRILGEDGEIGWHYPFSIQMQTIGYHGARIAGLNISTNADNCQPQWRDNGRPLRQGIHGNAGLRSADDVALLDDHGRPTAAVAELGLLPLVGYGRQDFHSLAGLLNRSRIPPGDFDTRLTIDSRLQGLAQQLLADGVADSFPIEQDPYALDRRAALVVMNARSGALLAVAGLPQVPQPGHFQDWDLASFARSWPALDPLRVRAWDSALDRHDAPGSTFKPITALTALRVAPEQPKVQGMLEGWNRSTFIRETGLPMATTAYDPYAETADGAADGRQRKLHNFRLANGYYESFNTLLRNSRLRAAECPQDTAASHTLGLPPATRDSLNIWFARLAMMVDGKHMDALDQWDPLSGQPRPQPAAQFSQTLRQLGFDRALDLLGDSPPFISQRGRPMLPPAAISLWDENPHPARWVLAQNAIGQGVAVTPLHIARLAASIAVGNVVQPHLVADWNGRPSVPVNGAILSGDLDLLRSGMRAVPQVGTAKRAFREVFAEQLDSPLRCNTYGKTGTAESSGSNGKAKYNSVWFMGWHQPDEGDPLAFSCMVSHAHGQGSRTGGQVCAPIVARFLAAAYAPTVAPDTPPTDTEPAAGSTTGSPDNSPGEQEPKADADIDANPAPVNKPADNATAGAPP